METGERDYDYLIDWCGRWLVTGWKYGDGRGEREDRKIGREILKIDIRGRKEYARLHGKRGITDGVTERESRV